MAAGSSNGVGCGSGAGRSPWNPGPMKDGARVPPRSDPGPARAARPPQPRPAGAVDAAAGCPSCHPTSVHQQPLDRIGSGVQGGLDGGQPIEALPAPLNSRKATSKTTPPAVLLPGPVDRPVGQGRLDQRLAVGVLPAGRRRAAVEHLDGPPLHGRYGNPAHPAALGASAPALAVLFLGLCIAGSLLTAAMD